MSLSETGEQTAFQTYYKPQSEEYLEDFRTVVDRLFTKTDERMGWYEPWMAWIVTSHDLCKTILADTRLTPDFMKWKFAPPEQAEADKNDFERMLDNALFRLDKEAHRRVRKLASKAFSMRMTEQIESQIKDVVVNAFDKLADKEFFNVADTLSVDIPRGSMSRLVGIPPEKEAIFHKLGWAMVRYNGIATTGEDREELLRAALEGVAMLQDVIQRRRDMPDKGDDFIGLLLTAQEGDDRLNDWEILGIVAAMIAAGSDTAGDMHPTLLYALLSNPEQFDKLKANPDLANNAITEILRYEAFGKTGLHRFALEDVEFEGITVKKGEQIIIAAQAGGLDPAQWDRPLELDIERNLNGNIVFGVGAHVCAGLFLARIQARLMLEEFGKRFPNAELAEPPTRDPAHYNARHITKLLVKTNI
ncbi:MAG: cytochrome P450 [Hellea sp.]|nr:cytochrome P450 [Hellea sp.]